MANNEDDGEQRKVGYKSPPRHTQFKKGQSGNPKGRRKKEIVDNVERAFRDFLRTDVQIAIDGEVQMVPPTAAYVRSVFAQAVKGKPVAMRLFADMLRAYGGPIEFRGEDIEQAIRELERNLGLPLTKESGRH